MRNVLVVLVLLCVGLSCGFIVPSGIREIIVDLNKSANSIEKSESKSRNMMKKEEEKTLNTSSVNITVTSKLLTKSVNRSRNNSLENDLYENSDGKDATIEERSFIYIKQRGKTPYLKNVFELLPKSNFENKAIKSYVLSHPILDDVSRRFLTDNTENNFSNKNAGQSSHDEYQPKINFNNFHIDAELNQQNEKTSKQPGEYKDLLKHPMVRPIIKTNEKDFISMEKSLFNFTIGRKMLTDIKDKISNKSAINLKNNELLEKKTTDLYDDKGHPLSEEDIDDDNLDQILKRLLENQIIERKSSYVDHNGFHFCRDCLKKAKKQALNSLHSLQLESLCKCGRKRIIKIIGDDIVN